MRPDSQPADKDLFLLQVTHPSINQNTPEELKSSAAQALKMIKEGLELEELHHTTEVDNNHFNKYLASAPPYEEEHDIELGAAGGTKEVKKEPTLPFESVDKIPGSKEDQDMWRIPTMPLLKTKEDKTGQMIIIYKNKNSKNKQTLKHLTKEYLRGIGLGNLTFQERSQENAEDASPEEIWGYLLRYVPEEEEGAKKGEKKAVTYASFIKEDVQDTWLDQAYQTINVNNDLRMTLLVKDANRDPILNDLKRHFAIWGEDVMTFLLQVIKDSEKEGTTEAKKEEPPIVPTITAEELRLDADKQAANRLMEKQKREHLEKEKQMAAITAKFNKDIEEKKELAAGLHEEISVISEVIRQTRLQSRRVSALPSRVVSRAVSPTSSMNQLLTRTREKLKGVVLSKSES